MKFVYILLFLVSFCVYASPEGDDIRGLQELRLAKAELALSQGKERFALYLVGKNLSQKYFHLDSYLFLANYYLDQRRVAKAFRVYHYVIKKLHPKGGKRLLRAANVSSVEKEFETINRPSEGALAIYYTLGQVYFDVEEKGLFSQKFSKQLLLNAKKYFTITNYYEFQKSDSNFFLGSLNSRLKKYGEAINNLSTAKELYEQEQADSEDDRSTEIQNINFMLADALIREGHTDSGAIFLKGLYLNPSVSSSLKEYANSYLDALSTVYKIVTLSLGYTYDSNANLLSDEEREDFENLKGIYVSEDALFFTKNFNYFYSSEKIDNFSYVFFIDATEQTVNDERKYFLENRFLTLGSTLKWDTTHRLIFKMGYSFTRFLDKESRQGGFRTDSDVHEFSPEFVRTMKLGTLSLRFPVNLTLKKGGKTSMVKGVNASFNPFWKNLYITPTFSLTYNLYDDPISDESSTQTIFSTSNHLVFIKNLSTFLTFTYGSYSNETETINYNKEITWNLDFSYVFKKWDNFSATYRFSKIDRRKEDGDEIDSTQHIFRLSINF
ncbi:MAG: hypothetical protein ACO20H_13305 [Bacteriovoracaceae bacterium]